MTRVLVVSEDTRYLKGAVERLRDAGIDATSACSAAAGRLMLEHESYDVVAAAEAVDGQSFDPVVATLAPDAFVVRTDECASRDTEGETDADSVRDGSVDDRDLVSRVKRATEAE